MPILSTFTRQSSLIYPNGLCSNIWPSKGRSISWVATSPNMSLDCVLMTYVMVKKWLIYLKPFSWRTYGRTSIRPASIHRRNNVKMLKNVNLCDQSLKHHVATWWHWKISTFCRPVAIIIIITINLWLLNKIFRNCHLATNTFFRFSPMAPNKMFGFAPLASNKIWPSTFPPTIWFYFMKKVLVLCKRAVENWMLYKMVETASR